MGLCRAVKGWPRLLLGSVVVGRLVVVGLGFGGLAFGYLGFFPSHLAWGLEFRVCGTTACIMQGHLGLIFAKALEPSPAWWSTAPRNPTFVRY